MLPLSSKERVCGKGGEFSTDSIGDFNTVFYNAHPAIIDEKLWNDAKASLMMRKQK
jgi:hypothetical protein